LWCPAQEAQHLGQVLTFQSFTWPRLPSSNGCFSATDPPLIREFSERNPQGFAQGAFRGILRKLATFPPALHMILMEIISSTNAADFQQLFRTFSCR
jgi:hypothetical protein